MDKQSAEMYSYPIVRVRDYKANENRIQAKCERIFGRQFDIADFVNFMAAPDGLETRLFARQVQRFREYGIDEIQLFADGYAGHPGGIIGYYVWARFGFSMTFGGWHRN